jgi:hypothetical protein
MPSRGNSRLATSAPAMPTIISPMIPKPGAPHHLSGQPARDQADE